MAPEEQTHVSATTSAIAARSHHAGGMLHMT